MLCAWCEKDELLGQGRFVKAGCVEGSEIVRRCFKCRDCLEGSEAADARALSAHEGRIEVLLGVL